MAVSQKKPAPVSKPRPKFRRLRAFASAFMLTLCLLLLGGGFFVADYNTRRMAFGENTVRMEYGLENGQLVLHSWGNQEAGELPIEWQVWCARAWNLLPARWRAATWLNDVEQATAPELIDWLGSTTAEEE